MKHLAKGMQDFFGRYPSLNPAAIASFVRDLDIPVTALEFEQLEKSSASQDSSNLRGRLASLLSSDGVKALLTHGSALGDAIFKFEEESEGTRDLIGFFFVWSLLREKIFPLRLVSIDEFDISLHPRIVASLAKQHLQLESPGQLIFTTHDTHLMDTKILRRDQIWLTERDVNGATQLRSIHDFEGRESVSPTPLYVADLRHRA